MLDTFVIIDGPDRSELMLALFDENQEQQIIYFKGVLLKGEEKPAMYDSLSSVVHGKEKLRLGMKIKKIIRRSNNDWIIYGEEILLETSKLFVLPIRGYRGNCNGDYSTISRTGSFPLLSPIAGCLNSD